jgi:hypothetical protein
MLWEGDLDSATQQPDGVHWTAHGLGSQGDDYTANFTTWGLDQPVSEAISRGLRWADPGISEGWLDVAPAPNSLTITDFLNSITSRNGLGWYVQRNGLLDIGTWPTEVNRLLISTTPIPRTLMKDINKMWILYQSGTVGGTGADAGNPIMDMTSVENTAAANKHGNKEEYLDLSASGVISEGTAQSGGDFLLGQYGRAMWTGSFTIHQGQLLTVGGVPVDIMCEQATSVCRLLINDSLLGEVNAGMVSFITGLAEHDVDAGTLTITPYNAFRNDLMAVIARATTTKNVVVKAGKYTTVKGVTLGGLPSGLGYGGGGGSGGGGGIHMFIQDADPGGAASVGDLWTALT